MFDFLKRKSRSEGSVLFRGSLPIPFERFSYLADLGVDIQPRSAGIEDLWAARISHPEWGEAELSCPRSSPPPARVLLRFDPRLMEAEVDAICDCSSSVIVRMTHPRQNVLRERKLALRMMHAIMGDHGVSVVDHGSGRFWSRPALEEELAHDADLDIESLFILHAVRPDEQEQGGVVWLHSHGLGELGYFDFDILEPSEDVIAGHSDLTRAIAFGITEGWIEADGEAVIAEPNGHFRMVPADRFRQQGAERWQVLRDDPEGSHSTRRSVLCEPAGGFFSKVFGAKTEPSRWLRGAIDENSIIRFSAAASELMAARARGTWALCRRYLEEFREFELKCLAKLGLPTDGDDGGREHLWFEVTHPGEHELKGILLNEPWHIASLAPGGSYSYKLDVLSEWTILTPVGRITPTEGVAVRIMRENREGILEEMRERRSNTLTAD